MNTLASLLQCAYPVIQAPMLGVTTPEMVAAIANAGGSGSLPVGGLSPERTRALIRATKALTSRPFAVNLFAHDVPPANHEDITAMQQFLQQLAADNALAYQPEDISTAHFYTYHDQVAVLLEEGIPVVSFTFGMLDEAAVQAFKAAGVVLIGTATSTREAVLLKESGIDIIAAQGIEAGGHRGTFLHDEPLPQIGVMTLVSQIIAHTGAMVIAAGGINSPAIIKAAFELGAVGVQMGTAFLASKESSAIPAYKDAVLHARDTDAVLTRAFSGRWARGLRNQFMDAVEGSGLMIPPYPYQNSITTPFRAAAQKADNKDMTNLWAGQGVASCQALPAAEIFGKMVSGVF